MKKIPKCYRIPFACAVALHLFVLILLIVEFKKQHTFKMNEANQSEVIQAVAINTLKAPAENPVMKPESLPPPPSPQVLENIEQRQLKVTKPIIEIPDEEDTKVLEEEKKQAEKVIQEKLAQQKKEEEEKIEIEKEAAEKLRQELAEKKQKMEQEKKALEEKKMQEKKAAMLKAKIEQQKKIKQAQMIKKQKALLLAKQKKLESQRLMQEEKALQQKLLNEEMASEQKQISQTQSQQSQGIIDEYKAQILQAIQANWVVPENADQHLSCILLIRIAPGGIVLGVDLIKSSGDPVLDRSATIAVMKAAPLPVPQDSAVFEKFRSLRLTVHPSNSL